MIASQLIKQLEIQIKRRGDLDVRLGEYGGGSSEIQGVYQDEDNESIIIY